MTPSAPLDASTVVLLRDSPRGAPEVFMVRRQRRSSFMADAFVFPGGRLDSADRNAHPIARAKSGASRATFGAIAESEATARALEVAAIREVFEESGVLIAVDERGAIAKNDQPHIGEARHAVHDATRSFRNVLSELGLYLAIDELCFFARWVTPQTEPKRFDARFFLARMPEGQTAAHDSQELVEQRFATPRALLDDHARGAIKLPPPTLWHLTDLAQFSTVDEALGWARRQDREVATVHPKLAAIDGLPAIVLPWDRDYPSLDGESHPISNSHSVAGKVSRYLLRDGLWSAIERAATD